MRVFCGSTKSGDSVRESTWIGYSLPVAAGWLFVAGTLLFSGSLYVMALIELRWLGAVTPLRGIAFAAGWLCLLFAAWRGQ
jgi:uncharacterized membrane protein YgdD (TMEM256/DUF423 family)